MRRLLLDLDPYGGTDPFGYVSSFASGMLPMFAITSFADVMAPRLSVVFRQLVRQFPGFLETGQCHANSERSTVHLCANYRPLSITSVLSKVLNDTLFVLDDLWDAVMCFQQPGLLIGRSGYL